jgi:hypothetical protein
VFIQRPFSGSSPSLLNVLGAFQHVLMVWANIPAGLVILDGQDQELLREAVGIGSCVLGAGPLPGFHFLRRGALGRIQPRKETSLEVKGGKGRTRQ